MEPNVRAYHFTTPSYGSDCVVIAESITEAMKEAASFMKEREGLVMGIISIKKLDGEVLLTPSIVAQLEVEAITGTKNAS